MKTNYTLLFILLFLLSGFSQGQPRPTIQSSIVNSPTSIGRQGFLVDKIYPNPVKDFVTIEIQSGTSAQVLISLYNILGTEIKKWELVELHEGDQKIRLDLSELKSGVYIFRFSVATKVYSQVIKKN